MDFKNVRFFASPENSENIFEIFTNLEYIFGNNLSNLYFDLYEDDLPKQNILLICTVDNVIKLCKLKKNKLIEFLNHNKILVFCDYDNEIVIRDLVQRFEINHENFHKMSDDPYSLNADIVIESRFLLRVDSHGLNLIQKNKQSNSGKFFCLMAKNRPHRNMLVQSLYKKELLPKGKVVYHGLDNNEQISKLLHKQKIFEDLEDFNQPSHSWKDGQYSKEYLEYNLEIVAETTTDFIFLTEKTIRPLAAGMPFLTIAAPNCIKHLHKLGFETYNQYIDESYDSIENLENRIDKVTDILAGIKNDDLIDIYNNTQSIGEHNRENFYKIKLNYQAILGEKLYNWIKKL
jgi:hypothetical protein